MEIKEMGDDRGRIENCNQIVRREQSGRSPRFAAA
jgi:hypothetical protein